MQIWPDYFSSRVTTYSYSNNRGQRRGDVLLSIFCRVEPMKLGGVSRSDDDARMVEHVFDNMLENLLAIIIPMSQGTPGISFVTADDSTHQLGILNWPKGHVIDSHVHNPIARSIDSTQEVLFVRAGRVRVDIYCSKKSYQCSRILNPGDVIFLVSGGHGFEILEDADIVEVKQGPYLGEGEKTRFTPKDNPHWDATDDL